MKMQWPDGKAFAFTVFDDTDLAVPGNFERVYGLLGDLGLRTTKSVWTAAGEDLPARAEHGSTCEDPDYLKSVLTLQKAGFEIGFHNSYAWGVKRARVKAALDRFRELFGHDPVCMSNHASSAEGMYWGPDRLSQPLRSVYRVLQRRLSGNPHQGHLEDSPYFWGDLCRERVRYVRNFVYDEIDTLGACPLMPYRDPAKPYVNAWFASTEGPEIESCVRALSEDRQDALEASGGACILYTHFAVGFEKAGAVDARFRRLVERLSRKNGWFVPVGTLLDHIRTQRGVTELGAGERFRLEAKWFAHKISVGGTS
jgi:hypothetical protein